MEWSEIGTHVAAFAMGVASGVLGKYFADRMTDRRKARERLKAVRSRFEAVRRQMPELIAEMKVDLSNPDQRLIRDFYVIDRTTAIATNRVTFRYYYEDHADLDNKIVVLVNNGYVQDTSAKNRPLYRMNEEFVDLVLNS